MTTWQLSVSKSIMFYHTTDHFTYTYCSISFYIWLWSIRLQLITWSNFGTTYLKTKWKDCERKGRTLKRDTSSITSLHSTCCSLPMTQHITNKFSAFPLFLFLLEVGVEVIMGIKSQNKWQMIKIFGVKVAQAGVLLCKFCSWSTDGVWR